MFLKILFTASALLTVSSAIGVVVVKNLVHSCIALLGCFIGVAGLYVTLGADFVAAVQFMVYVGGVIILMLFAIMLTGNREGKNPKKSQIFLTPIMGNKKTIALGAAMAIVFMLSVGKILWGILGFSNAKGMSPAPFGPTVDKIGTLLLTDHVLAFEMASVLLLGALIGAAIIARPKTLENERGED